MPPEIATRVREPLLDGRPASSWWHRYRLAVQASGLTETGLEVLGLDSELIVDTGVFGAGHPAQMGNQWPASRLRRGLVVGSVQSGKTASMLGVTARCLDKGMDIVVVLAGTRVALWRQTLERTLSQLDGWTPENSGERPLSRVFVPDPEMVVGEAVLPELRSLYHVHTNLIRRHLELRRPFIAVVMKQVDHLLHFASFLQSVVERTVPRLERPLHMLVVDDEADDGSILDADVEAGLAPDSEALRQLPRHIARLWGKPGSPHTTSSEHLFATYLAYTATPQANFLQSAHNPLSPKDFVVALRTPFNQGNVGAPRSTTYEEPLGLSNYYCGGELFYGSPVPGEASFAIATPLVTPSDFDDEEEYRLALGRNRIRVLGNAMRCFLVGAAVRMHRSGLRMTDLESASHLSLEEVQRYSPPVTTMLVHPSASIQDQFVVAKWLAAWAADPTWDGTRDIDTVCRGSAALTLDAEGLGARLTREAAQWSGWLQEFERTSGLLSHLPGARSDAEVRADWIVIEQVLRNEVFPFVRLRLINSDPQADDRPRFSPIQCEDQSFRGAPDLLSIFVSGNVMARGVTLEGLTTTLFLRVTDRPSADTQMQMQRWFGYRGNYLDLCRVFLHSDQLDRFRLFHENDEALKSEILEATNRTPGRALSPLVLQGATARATSKIANLRTLPLCPGPQPFVRVLATTNCIAVNAGALADLLDATSWTDLVVGGRPRGKLCTEQFSLTEVAGVLEQFRYEDHRPGPLGSNHRRWQSISQELALEAPAAPLFRPPSDGAGLDAVAPHECPYSIAAYLRLWSAALTRHARGLFPTDDPTLPWSMIDLASYALSAPKFYIGIRFGDAGLATDRRLRAHGIQCMTRQYHAGRLTATWGSRNPGSGSDSYLGDHLFDYHVSGLQPSTPIEGEPAWRPRGHPGLVLLHVVRLEGVESVGIGLALPLGGPDHFAALPAARDGGTGE